MTTLLANVQNQIQTFWSPLFMAELREALLLGGLVNRDYQGQIQAQGDTVRVSQLNAATGQLKTVGTDADTFTTETLSTSYVDIKADKRAVAGYEFEDLVYLQSQIGGQDSDIRQSLLFAVSRQINDYLYSLISPSTSAPDHVINGVSDLNAAQVSATRILAAQAKWPMNKPWYALLDPQFYGDVLDDTTLASTEYGATDAPMIGGQLGLRRFGFTMFEDNSLSADHGYFFHPDFLALVMQQEVRFKLSDQHANKRFGFILSADIVFGAKQLIDGNKKVIHVYNT